MPGAASSWEACGFAGGNGWWPWWDPLVPVRHPNSRRIRRRPTNSKEMLVLAPLQAWRIWVSCLVLRVCDNI